MIRGGRAMHARAVLKSAAEMRALFADLRAVENTRIARRCTLTLKFGTYHLPEFPVPAGVTVPAFLQVQAREELARRLQQHPPQRKTAEEYAARLEYELGIIEKMGFAGYFLVVADFIAWGKANTCARRAGR